MTTRITAALPWAQLEALADAHKLRRVIRPARCSHGRTLHQRCVACELHGPGGDWAVHVHAGRIAQHQNQALVAISPDSEDVMYIPQREERKLR